MPLKEQKVNTSLWFLAVPGVRIPSLFYLSFLNCRKQSGIPDDAITMFGVNRAKTSLGNIAKAFNVTLVPTIIVMKDGKEIGRVVEYGKTGKWDKELAEIINNNIILSGKYQFLFHSAGKFSHSSLL